MRNEQRVSEDWQNIALHQLCWWGELIYGTKDQLQALGLGAGLAFPGEVGGPRRVLNVVDPRGLPTRIKQLEGQTFSAHIDHPGRHQPCDLHPSPIDVAPGVKLRKQTDGDEYVGTGQALVSAGLVRPEWLPGGTDMPKYALRVTADGSVYRARRGHRGPSGPGVKSIQKMSAQVFRVTIAVPREEGERRHSEWTKAWDRMEADGWRMPRPAPLPGLTDPQRFRADLTRVRLEHAKADAPLQAFLAELQSHA